MKAAWASGFFVFSIAWAAMAMPPRDVFKQAAPAVVLILGSDDGRAGSGGTGSIIFKDGRVITNAHVVINEAGKPFKMLYVFLKPPKLTGDNARDLNNRYEARVVAFSPAQELDLAVLQIDMAPENLPTIAFTDPERVEVGQEVVAIGHPEQGGLWTLTTGTISTVVANFGGVRGKNVFQTEASVNRGNSGGPLLDDQGQMVGINTMIARQGAGGVAITDINFSLKSSVAVDWLAAQGMVLAYGKKPDSATAVAQAEKPRPVAEDVASEQVVTTVAKPGAEKSETPAVAAKTQVLGKEKAAEKVVAGKPFDPKKAKPTFVTQKRPFNLDDLRAKQMKELEDMMDEMRRSDGKGNSENQGMGLW